MSSNIEVVNLERGERYDGADRPLAPFVSGAGHVVYAPWDAAEREVKARALRTLAARQTPPDGVAFVRTWELVPTPTPWDAHIAQRQADAQVLPAVQTLSPHGITQSGSFGPAAEMAARARDAELAAPKPRGRRGR